MTKHEYDNDRSTLEDLVAVLDLKRAGVPEEDMLDGCTLQQAELIIFGIPRGYEHLALEY